ncbi:MAG TPA: hypothetical protein PLB55_11630 [Prosthecobacter sp.]|nr:hypothetical protein [Prosthecobacter sp.]
MTQRVAGSHGLGVWLALAGGCLPVAGCVRAGGWVRGSHPPGGSGAPAGWEGGTQGVRTSHWLGAARFGRG